MIQSFLGTSFRNCVWFAWFFVIVFVFPIPGTIALRNLFFLMGLVALVLPHTRERPEPVATLRLTGWSLLVLTVWIVVQAVTLSPWPELAFPSMRGDWLVPLLLGYIGAWAAKQMPPSRALQAVVFALAVHMVWLLTWQVRLWLVGQAWPFKVTPFAAYDYHGTLNSFFFALLAADRLGWALRKVSPLGIRPQLAWILMIVSLVSDLALGSRNSSVVTVFLLFAVALTLLRFQVWRWRTAFFAIGTILLVSTSSLINDPRWRGGIESGILGWNSPELFFQTISDPSLLKFPSGKPIEQSAFARAALASLAIDGVMQHPLGLGIGHDAFGRLVPPQYGHPTMGGSSHSGWLDFALGAGLPGLGLLLLTAGLAIRGGWKQFENFPAGSGVLFSFFVAGYLFRCLLDGHLSGWRLGLFAFICGALIASMKKPAPES